MKVSVPEEFLEVLRKIEKEVKPGNVVYWLEWASMNPEEAKRMAEAYGKLGRCGRHEFELCLWFGNSPDDAIKSAVEDDARHREKRSLLSRAIANAKRGGYKFTLPNGAKCSVIQDVGEDAYWFHFEVAGGKPEEKVSLLYGRRGLGYALETLKENRVSSYRLEVVSYRGKFYKPWTNTAATLIRAVEENIDPEVLATVNL